MSAGRPVILDGAMGTALDELGADTREPLWSARALLDRPKLVASIHRAHLAAGAEILTTCTFRTTRRAFALAEEGEGRWREAALSAVDIARRAAGDAVVVAGGMGPLEDCFRPDLAPSGERAEEEHFLLADLLASAGVDVLWLETFGASGEIRAALRAARRAGNARGIPFVLNVTTTAHGTLVSGEPLAAAAALAEEHGACAFGVNCVPPAHVPAALGALSGATRLPLAIYANLGFPEDTQDWRGSAFLPPEEYADRAAAWVEAGAAIVGGCCGSTAAHIRALAERFAEGAARYPRQ